MTEDITAALEGSSCYRRRDEAIAAPFPEYDSGWKIKIVLPGNLLEEETLNVLYLTVTGPDGREFSRRLLLREYYQAVALDVVWSGYERSIASEELAEALALSAEQVKRGIAGIVRKQRTTVHLRIPPVEAQGWQVVQSAHCQSVAKPT